MKYKDIIKLRNEIINKLNSINDMHDLSKDELIILINMLVDIIEEYERRYN